MRRMLCALALLLGLGMAAAPARAQHEQHAQHGQRDHAAMMAEHHRELGLTADQTQRMEAIHTRLAATMRAHCERVRAAGGPNAQTHAAMHGEMQTAMETAHREMTALLTDAQRAKMDSLHTAHRGAGGHDMAAMHARHDSAGHGGHGEHSMPHDSTGMAKMHEEMCQRS
ncbi:MAG: Spy/CpxP family protein refolding chaperone [Longimicrobiaceae bacterium]